MPCTISEADARLYEEEANHKTYGMKATDEDITIAAACEACRTLENFGMMHQQSKLLNKWWKKHKKEDAKRDQ